ncbi:MAG: 30S ribosomal protein S1 [Actinomycetota bacterium]|nr:30S ribosomal protein S1 [Actinomycetota bacterium]
MIVNEAGVLVPDYDLTIKVFDDGDIVCGDVVKIDRDEVLVDIGYKSEGAIPVRELSIRPDVNPFDVVKIGDRIEALVLQKEDKDGRLILSRKRAEYEKAWVKIEKIAAASENISGEVIEVVKGGLIVDIGLRGFLPASLVDIKRTKDLEQYIGQTLECKVIEMDRNRNNVVLSRRAVLEEEKKQEKSKILEKISKGARLTGKISSIVDFGAFVDLGGIDGLIHISELCWDHIDHPSEVVSVGDEVEVQVLDVDLDRGRISLGLKQTQKDPWRERVEKYTIGQIITGKVTKLMPFGAFVQIEDGLEGLVHISELSYEHIEAPEEVVKVGDDVEVKVTSIDNERRRISLSIKQVQESPQEEKADVVEDMAEDVVEDVVEDVAGDAAEDVQEVQASEEVAQASKEVVHAAEEAMLATEIGESVAETQATDVEEAVAKTQVAEIGEAAAEAQPVEIGEAAAEAQPVEVVETAAEIQAAEMVAEVASEPEPESLEAVLEQMKAEQARKSTTD